MSDKNISSEEDSKDIPVKYHSQRNYVKEFFIGLAENTLADSALVSDSFLKPYNPDDIWRKQSNFSLYEDMLKDEQVWVSSQLKKDLVIGSGFDIVAEDEDQDEIVEDLKIALREDPDVPFEEMLEQMLPYDFGFTITEKIFKKRDDGSITLKKLKTPHPDTWIIHTDEKGNVTRYEQVGIKSGSKDIDPNTLIHFVNQRRFQNPYGKSDLRAAYNPWFVKRHIIRFYSIYLEKTASPTPVGSFDSRRSNSDDVDEAFKALKKLQTRTAMMIPNDISVEFLETKSNGEAYIKGINLFNMFIGRSMFIPDLIGFQGGETGGGSMALGKNQIDVFFKHINKRRASLEQIINHHIIKPIVKANWGDVKKYPKFKLKPIDDDSAIQFAKTWIEAQKGKIYKPSDDEINHLRSLLKFPEGGIDRDEIEDKEENNPILPQENPNIEVEDAKEKKSSNFAKKIFDDTPGDYSKKVDFKAVLNQLESVETRIMQQSIPIVDEIFESLKDQIEKKRIISNNRFDRINELKIINKKKLQLLLKKEFRDHYKMSQEIARNELFKSNFSIPLDDDTFLEFLDNETFEYIGKYEYSIKEDIAILLRKAIKDGMPLSSVIEFSDQEIREKSDVSLERYSRTKTTEILNRGRHAFFSKSGIVSGYQYSAILDDRTTPICSGLHGKFFKKGSEPIPPLHFNCRSLIIPITKFEKFTPSEKVGKVSIDDFIDKNIGKGFSRK